MTHPEPTFNAVCLAVDGSSYAETATRYAAFLGRRLHLPLYALHIIDAGLLGGTDLGGVGGGVGGGALIATPTTLGADLHEAAVHEALETRGEALLAGVQALAERVVSSQVHTELRTGLTADEILQGAHEDDLLVLGRQGEGAGGGADGAAPRLGGVAERVLRRAPGAVLVTPERFREPRRLLLAYDGSEAAAQALPYALAFAASLELPLVAVSVQDDPALAETHLEVVRRAAQGHPALSVSTHVLRGDATQVILEALQEGDVLAIGAFGEGRLSEFFRGSTTEALLRGAEVPVLLHS